MPAPFLPAVAVPRLCYPVQWVLGATVPSNGGNVTPVVTGPSTHGWPLDIGANRWVGITNVQFSSKYGAIGRSSYFCVNGLITVTDVTQTWSCGHPSQALLAPPNTTINGSFWNNEMENEFGALSGENVNMNAIVRGFMVDHQFGMTIFTALHGIDWDKPWHPGEVVAG